MLFFFSSRRRHTRSTRDWSSDVCSSDLAAADTANKFPEDIQAMMRKPDALRTPFEQQLHELAWRQVEHEYDHLEKEIKGAEKETLLALRRELAKFDALKPAPLPVAFAATEIGPVAPPLAIPKRGSVAIEP